MKPNHKKRALILLGMALGLISLPILSWTLAKPLSHALGKLTVEGNNWGSASHQDIEALLQNVRRNNFSVFKLPPMGDIEVRYQDGNPWSALHQKPTDPHRIYLSATDRNWAQYSYQFAHELCHVAALDDLVRGAGGESHLYGWLHESLCETAALFTLRRMADDWKKNAPYANWTDFGPHLRAYAQVRIDAPVRHLPDGVSLGEWYRANRVALEANAELRPFNNIVSNRMLPIFEADPTGWQALAFWPADMGTLPDYLQAWQDQSPAELTLTIQAIAQEFQIKLAPRPTR